MQNDLAPKLIKFISAGLFIFLMAGGNFNLLNAQSVTADEPRMVVLNLAAHPDDEDGRTLTYYRKEKDAIAYSIIYTRGEGGQNEIGPELYEALGAVRTQETERAARILGTQIFFMNFKDFGYSKHAHEAFQKWGGEDYVTSRLVYMIRKLKPNVIFTNHDTVTVAPNRQHGQHQVVGISAWNAFEKANDPAYHPEQLTEFGVDLWQPDRLFLRHWREPEGEDHINVPVGTVNEAAGKPYSEIALDALNEHESQGMGMFAAYFRTPFTHFTLERSKDDLQTRQNADHESLPAPLDPSDLTGNLALNTKAAPALSYWIDSGRIPPFPMEHISVSDEIVVPGQTFTFSWDENLTAAGKTLQWKFSGILDTVVTIASGSAGSFNLTIPNDTKPTLPKETEQYQRFVNQPPIMFMLGEKDSGDLMGAGYLPVEIAPAAMLPASNQVIRLHSGSNQIPVSLTIEDQLTTKIDLTASVMAFDQGGSALAQASTRFDVKEAHVDGFVTVDLPLDLPAGNYGVTLTAIPNKTSGNRITQHKTIDARVIETANLSKLRVGLIKSYDNTLENALSAMGIPYVMLDSASLAQDDFAELHTIIVDIRAYLVRPDLRMYNQRLLDWVEKGGHMVVNYQKVFEWNAQYDDPFIEGQKNPAGFAPYPITLGRQRVTFETAAVTELQPDHILLNQPHVITNNDWNQWVQERGLYFPQTWNEEHFIPLFSMHDPDEPALTGSTLLAAYGKGTYLYTSLVWYRQLKIYHPGAYRIFANLISLPLFDGRRNDL